MARRLARPVVVFNDAHVAVSFVPGEVPPDWAVGKITNPEAWADGEAPVVLPPDAVQVQPDASAPDPLASLVEEPAPQVENLDTPGPVDTDPPAKPRSPRSRRPRKQT